MLILRIRQAEVALADGRLDEACELAQSPAVREHRHGQRLITRLVRALVDRGQAHRQADRLNEALADCQKAEGLAGNLPEVAALRAAASEALLARQHQQRDAARRVAAAKRWIDDGQLTMGAKLLQADYDSQAAGILEEIETKRQAIETAAQSADAAMQRDDFDEALGALSRGEALGGQQRLAQVRTRLVQAMLERCRSAIHEGRVDRAAALALRIAPFSQAIDVSEVLSSIALCRAAWEMIGRGRIRDAEASLRRLQWMHPKARWIEDVLKTVQQACTALDQLRAGPLGLAAQAASESNSLPAESAEDGDKKTGRQAEETGHHLVTSSAFQVASAAAARRDAHALRGVPERFILQIDGVGSFLVLRRGVVTVGAVSSSCLADLGLIAEPALPGATIERIEEDYFVRGAALQVNDRPVNQKLLSHGDRIVLSPRCRFTFRLPSGASTSAVLDLDGARAARGDIRRVILMDGELIIGAGGGAHVRVDALEDPMVLLVRDGQLICQSRRGDVRKELSVGVPATVGHLSLVVTQAS